MKKYRFIMMLLFCIILVSGCNKEEMKEAAIGTDSQTVIQHLS